MVEQVEITGFGRGVPDWATEDTLRDIRDYMQTQVNLNTATTTTTAVNQQANTKAAQKNASMSTKATQSIAKALIVGGASFEKILKNTLQTSTDKLANDSGALGKLVVLVSGSLYQFNAALIEINSSYRELYNSGVSLEGSFVDIVGAAGRAEMGISEFAMAAAQNSQLIAAYSGIYEDGAGAFGSLIKNIRTNLIPMGQLGLATSDVVEMLGDYMEAQRMIGIRTGISETRRAQVLTEYLQQVTMLSQLTGKNRKQLAQEMQERIKAPGFSAFLASQEDVVRDSVAYASTSISAVSSDLGQLFEELVRFGQPMSDTTALLSGTLGKITPELQALAKRVKTGEKISQQEMESLIRRWGSSAKKIYKEQGEHLSMGIAQNAEYAAIIKVLQEMATSTGKINVQFTDRLTKLYNNLDTLLDKGIAPFTKKFGDILEYLVKDNGPLDRYASTVAEMSEDLIKWIDKLVNEPFAALMDAVDYIGDKVSYFGRLVADAAIRIAENLLEWTTETAKKLGSFLKDLAIDLAKQWWQGTKDSFTMLKAAGLDFFDYLKDLFKSLLDWLPGTPERSAQQGVGDPTGIPASAYLPGATTSPNNATLAAAYQAGFGNSEKIKADTPSGAVADIDQQELKEVYRQLITSTRQNTEELIRLKTVLKSGKDGLWGR